MVVSRKCVKTWLDRCDAQGENGLTDRSSRPHRTPTRTSAEVEARVVDLRRRERRARTGSAPSSASRPGPCRGSCAATTCPG